MSRIKYDPLHFTLYGFVFYFVAYIIGPYNWEIKDWNAIMVLILGYIFFFAGMILSKGITSHYRIQFHASRLSHSNRGNFPLTKISEKVLVIGQIIVTAAFFIYIMNIRSYISISRISELTDTRYMLADNLSFVQKLANYIVFAGIPIYIITGYTTEIHNKLLRVMRTPCFWMPAVSFLVTSARWNFILSVFIFFFVNYDTKRTEFELFKKEKGKLAKRISIIIIILLGIVVLVLFGTRGINTSVTTQMPYYGTIDIKDAYVPLFGLKKMVYQVFFYINHSVPYFTKIYGMFDFSHPQFGTDAFSHLRIIIPAFGNWNEFVKYNPIMTGSYVPTIGGFFIDWGFYGAFIAIFLVGYIFEYIHIRAEDIALMRYLKPIVLFQCFMSLEGYVLNIAATNILAFVTIVIGLIVLITNKIRTNR